MTNLTQLKSLLAAVALCSAFSANSQCAYNREWVSTNASPDTVDITASVADNYNHIILTGNTLAFGQGSNFLTVKYDEYGAVLWQQQFNGTANGSDYGTAVTTDLSGNVYVTGASYANAAQGYNYMTIKYSPGGTQLWSVSYNGPGNSYDVTSGIVVDNSGNVYVTGASKGTGSPLNLDYATIKYNSSGVQQWASRYNFAGMPDLAVGILLDNTNNVLVTGTSASSLANSDITTVKYSNSGTQLAVHRFTVSGNALDQARGIEKDNLGNVYVVGSTNHLIGQSNTQLIKYNSSLSLVWSDDYDGEGLTDEGTCLDIDAIGNIFIGGYVKKVVGGKDFLTLKYNSSGSILWDRRQSATNPVDFGAVHKMIADGNGGVVVTGEMTTQSAKDYLTIMYDATGTKMWENYFNGSGNGNDCAYAINMLGNDIVVSGKTTQGATEEYTTIKYSTWQTNFTVDNTNGVYHAANQIVIQFDPSVLIMSNVDDDAIQFGQVSTFVDAVGISKMNAKLGVDVTKWTLVKIYPWLKSTDTISISRQGEDVRIPNFWATFVLYSAGIQDHVAADSLNRCQAQVWKAELNFLYELYSVPNDPYIPSQNSYYASPGYPNGGINIYPAWDFSTGRSFVKVGVYDSGIDQDHPDFGGVPLSGYNFLNGTSLGVPYDNSNHGTRCAGIIGAKSNNAFQGAGIAGGDNSAANPGVELYDMKISDASSFAPLNTIANALVAGATSQSAGGYGLWVMSNSWGGPNSSMEIHDAVHFSNKNGVIVCAARGNYPNNQGTDLDDKIYPACFRDDLVLNCGGSGSDGEWKSTNNGNPNDPVDAGQAMTKEGVDCIAPATNLLVYTTESTTGNYGGFNGTSASTPHVAGLAALMASYYDQPFPTNSNLCHEDVEQIIERTCIDKFPAGYDDETGWGLIDGGAALAAIEYPYYKVRHFGTFTNVTSFSVVPTLIASQTNVFIDQPYQGLSGWYIADIYSSTHTLNYSIGPNEQILATWTRASGTIGWPFTSTLGIGDDACTIVSATSTQAVVKTYMYHIISDLSGQILINDDIPCPSYQTKVGITLYTYDASAVGVDENIPNSGMQVYPNPTSDIVNVSYNVEGNEDVVINVYSMTGQIVKSSVPSNQSAGLHTEVISIADIAEGVYIMEIIGADIVGRQKFIVRR